MTEVIKVWAGLACLLFIAIAPTSCMSLQGINSSLNKIAVRECGK